MSIFQEGGREGKGREGKGREGEGRGEAKERGGEAGKGGGRERGGIKRLVF